MQQKLPSGIEKLIIEFQQQIKNHHVSFLGQTGKLKRGHLKRFAKTQFGDCVWWVPMLALIKDKVQNPRLHQAALDNLLCEAGAKHTSHITLGYRFLKALKITDQEIADISLMNVHRKSILVILKITNESEAVIAGWLLASEGLVPELFKSVLPSFRKFLSEDECKYLTEHISVDEEEHVVWMIEAVNMLITDGAKIEEVMKGVRMAGNVTISFLDDILKGKN